MNLPKLPNCSLARPMRTLLGSISTGLGGIRNARFRTRCPVDHLRASAEAQLGTRVSSNPD